LSVTVPFFYTLFHFFSLEIYVALLLLWVPSFILYCAGSKKAGQNIQGLSIVMSHNLNGTVYPTLLCW
jgi:hypothetical protein